MPARDTAALVRSSAADRMDRHRARARRGERVMPVVIDEFATIEWLISSGRLSECDALDGSIVSEALARFIREAIMG